MSNGTIIISSYLPTYRTPPPPVQCIQWDNCDLLHFGQRCKGHGINIDRSANYSVQSGPNAVKVVTGFYVTAIAKRYIMQHPEMLECDDTMFKLGFARSMLCHMALEARRRGRVDIAIGSGLIEGLQPPDDLLDFEYVRCSLTINVAPMLAAVRRNHHLLKDHIAKRASDRRYKYMHDRRLKNFKYWLNPENWIGFAAGFLVDFYIYRILPCNFRQAMWRLPQCNYSTDEGCVSDYININSNLAKIFQDEVLLQELSRRYIQVMPAYCSSWSIVNTPLDKSIDLLITSMLKDPEAYKQRLIDRRNSHVETPPTQGQQGTVLQTGNYTVGQGIQLSGAPARAELEEALRSLREAGAVSLHAPVTEGRQVPVHRDDGAVIGTRRVEDNGGGPGAGDGDGREQAQPNEARAELDRLLDTIRQRNNG